MTVYGEGISIGSGQMVEAGVMLALIPDKNDNTNTERHGYKMTAAGLIFSNIHDQSIPEMTATRTMASLPFGGRYGWWILLCPTW